MPSEHRLHPLSFLFGLGRHLSSLLLPGLLLLFTAQTGRWGGWEPWAALGVLPVAIGSLFQYFFLRYRYDRDEMVIRSGFVFRNERHIPYARIQNIDATQNVVHRLLGVADVRVETGGGQKPEATLSVLPLEAFEEMRRRVFEEKRRAASSLPGAVVVDGEPPMPEAVDTAPVAALKSTVLIRLPDRELLLWGVIQNRGMVAVGAAFGIAWELGLADRLWGRYFGELGTGRGFFRNLAGALLGLGTLSAGKLALTLVAFAALLVVLRVISMALAFVRLHGFVLERAGGDLRSVYGLLTRYSATVPVHRIQSLTIVEGPLHRLFKRASLRVDTAGGSAVLEEGGARREWLVPLVRRDALPSLLGGILPELDPASVAWRPAHPRAFARKLKSSLLAASALGLACAAMLRWWDLALLAMLMAWALVHARLYVNHLGHALTPSAVLFRSGWLWRHTTIARFSKLQAIAVHESPFDRRAGMARVHVDTAGAAATSHRVSIPYLVLDDARALFAVLSEQAARTTFRW
jgi:putative membrane protein